MEAHKTFDRATVYRSFFDFANALPDDAMRGRFYTGLLGYSLNGIEPDFNDDLLKSGFILARPTIDTSNGRRTNGKIGGEANSKQNESKTEANTKQTATQYHVSSTSNITNSNSKKNAKEKSFVSLIPDSLKTDSFNETWLAWEKHLREKRKPLTESAAERQLKKLSALKIDDAISTIERSIQNNWQGIFPEEAKEEELSIFEKIERGIPIT